MVKHVLFLLFVCLMALPPLQIDEMKLKLKQLDQFNLINLKLNFDDWLLV